MRDFVSDSCSFFQDSTFPSSVSSTGDTFFSSSPFLPSSLFSTLPATVELGTYSPMVGDSDGDSDPSLHFQDGERTPTPSFPNSSSSLLNNDSVGFDFEEFAGSFTWEDLAESRSVWDMLCAL